MSSRNWPTVRKALNDPRWDFRTVAGIVKDTGLSPECVKHELKQSRREIRQSIAANGTPVYTLTARPRKWREILDDDAEGEQLAVLWEHELDARVVKDSGWGAIAEKGFDHPPLFAAYLRTLSWNCVTATDPRLFQAPFRAGIRTEIYQLEPLSKALQLARVNLFIADDVGVGKTIEAGLIARELLLRRRIDKIVVACPPPRCSTSGTTRCNLGSGSCSPSSTERT